MGTVSHLSCYSLLRTSGGTTRHPIVAKADVTEHGYSGNASRNVSASVYATPFFRHAPANISPVRSRACPLTFSLGAKRASKDGVELRESVITVSLGYCPV